MAELPSGPGTTKAPAAAATTVTSLMMPPLPSPIGSDGGGKILASKPAQAAGFSSRSLATNSGTLPMPSSTQSGNTNVPFLFETLAIAATGAWLGLRLKIPAGGLLVPMAAAALLQGAGYLTITLPKPLLLFGYGAIGLSIGLRFSRDLLRRTVRALPEMLAG